ncbi:MAG TPA: AmmeMemoRadiSam system protein A [Clostridiales bacterium]|nr:AmmeMemoRadiSam system protein A [Clostridiales bacterium]
MCLKNNDPYIELAQTALETYLKNGYIIDWKQLKLNGIKPGKRGCFVTIRKNNELRGCMGTFQPERDCLADEIIHNAIFAGVMDSRFLPVTCEELPSLEYVVDVLEEPERICITDEYNVREYGIIVIKDNRTGLLLPDLTGISTKEEQLNIALSKAGISRDENFTLMRFRVEHHSYNPIKH